MTRSTPRPARSCGKLHGADRRAAARQREDAGAGQGDLGNANDVPITGGGTWSTYTLDTQRGLLYIPTGNPGPDFTLDVRPGSNLYTNSVLVLDAKTGIYRNHYSLVPADFHDWDLSAAPVLVTTKGGKRIVAGAPKDGLLHVYDLDDRQKLTRRR